MKFPSSPSDSSYASFLASNLHQQIQRAGYFQLLGGASFLAFSLVTHGTWNSICHIYGVNGILFFFATIGGMLFLRSYPASELRFLELLYAAIAVDLSLLESYTSAKFGIGTSPIFALGIFSMFMKLLVDQTAFPSHPLRHSIFTSGWFVLCTILADRLFLPLAKMATPPPFLTFLKAFIAFIPFFLMAPVYRLLASRLQEQITRASKLNEALIDSMRFIVSGQNVTSIMHDLRNILHAIESSSAVFFLRMRKSNLDATNLHKLDSIEGGFARASEMLNQFLELATLDAHRQERVSVKDSLEQAVGFLLACGNSTKGIHFSWSIHGDMQKAIIQANAYRLLSVFLNILTNATQALKESEHPSPAIAIAILLEEGSCSVRIEDNGPGIPAEILPKLFERFTSRTGGIGLGLTLAYDYVEHELHGTLHAESAPGKYTAFIVTLPTVP